ncbi:MAG: hypothetical protein K6E30_09545 [Lachnospiraceae bacterium]|nr:hypothetical protein [Lachnospiraceae bacterium]
MIDEERLHAMIRLSLYENGVGKDDLRIRKFFRGDYVALELLKAFFSVTIGYVLIFALAVLMNVSFIMTNIARMDFIYIGSWLLIGYIALMGLYLCAVYMAAFIRYNRAKRNVSRYMAKLSRLDADK